MQECQAWRKLCVQLDEVLHGMVAVLLRLLTLGGGPLLRGMLVPVAILKRQQHSSEISGWVEPLHHGAAERQGPLQLRKKVSLGCHFLDARLA